MDNLGELFGGLGEIFGGVSEAVKGGASDATEGGDEAGSDDSGDTTRERRLAGRRRILNVNDT